MGRKTLRHENLPASNDPRWGEWSRLVLALLDTPQTIDQLKDWARAERVQIGKLINALSWLDLKGFVETGRTPEGVPFWVRLPPPVIRVPAPVPKRCPRCSGCLKMEPERIRCLQCGHSIYPPGDA